jgi:hypothetical protein
VGLVDTDVIVVESQSELNGIPVIEIFAGERETSKNGNSK